MSWRGRGVDTKALSLRRRWFWFRLRGVLLTGSFGCAFGRAFRGAFTSALGSGIARIIFLLTTFCRADSAQTGDRGSCGMSGRVTDA
jgi:hypothetical protein